MFSRFIPAFLSNIRSFRVPRAFRFWLLLSIVIASWSVVFGANPIQTENAKTGTTAWQLTNPATNREIEGYASLTSVNRGGQIKFFVNTTDANFTIQVFRMGWYGGLGARLVAGPITVVGTQQTMPTMDSTTGLVECNWINPYVLSVPANTSDPSDWASGVYLAKLTGATSGKQSYIIFVVRDDARHSDYLVQSSVTTFQAYNPWGGKSLYPWNSTDTQQARKVSFNRPYAISPYAPAAYGMGAGEFLANEQPGPVEYYGVSSAGWEYNMVRFLEREGYDATYCTDVDTHSNASLPLSHKGFLTMGHDEYWSWEMRANVEAARNAGINLAFFSANTCYWEVRFEAGRDGTANRNMVCYKQAATTQDPLALDGNTSNDYLITNKWRLNSFKPPEDALLGVMYEEDPVDSDIVLENASSWVCAGTGLRNGDHLFGLLGYEVDRMFNNAPAGTARIAHSPYTTLKNDFSGYSDMTVYTASSGATVFAAGSIQWSFGLDDYNAPALRPSLLSTAAQQMTRNVLASFVGAKPAPPAGPTVVMSDDFNDNSRDLAKWALGTIQGQIYSGAAAWDSAMPVLEQNQRLEISPRSNMSGAHYNGYVSANTINLTNASATVQVVQSAVGARSDTQLALCIDTQNFYMMLVEDGQLYFDRALAGERSQTSVPYDPTQHRYWRIRHTQIYDAVLYETSPDGQTWTLQRAIAREMPVTALKAEISAGTYGPEAAPGTAVFDNFRVEALSIAPINRAPIASPGGPYTGSPSQTLQFDGSASSDPDGTIASYQWSFGDGTTASGAKVSHAYASTGTYTVTLTVTDNAGATNNASSTATITQAGVLLSDDFNDNTRDPAKWVLGTIQGGIHVGAAAWDSAMPVLETNQRLQITPRTGMTGTRYNGYVSASMWNLTNAMATVEVPQVASGGNTDSQLALCNDSQNFFMILVEGGVLYFDLAINGQRSQTSLTYNASLHRFWRIRHVQSTDTMAYQTSSDGLNWITQRSIARPIPITAMKVELSAGTYEAESLTGTTIFDNFRLETTSATPTTNQAPVAKPGGPYSGTAGTAISLNGAGSTDSDGTIASYQWSFGDGSSGTGATVSHAYAAAGTYTVKLTVTDNAGAASSATTTATVSTPAPVNAAQFISQSVPSSIQHDKSFTVSVTMKNTGTTTWSEASAYRLGSQNPQDNSTWGISRAILPASVAPGATVTFSFTLKSPKKNGNYNFQWQMVRDGTGYFGDQTPNLSIQVK